MQPKGSLDFLKEFFCKDNVFSYGFAELREV